MSLSEAISKIQELKNPTFNFHLKRVDNTLNVQGIALIAQTPACQDIQAHSFFFLTRKETVYAF